MRFKRPQVRYANTPQPATRTNPLPRPGTSASARPRTAKNWRLMAFGCLTLAVLMAGGLVWRSAQSIVTPTSSRWTTRVRCALSAKRPRRTGPAMRRLLTTSAASSVWCARCPSTPSWCGRTGSMPMTTTDKGAVVLNEYARVNDPFARIGRVGDGAGQQRDSRERYVVQRALDGDPFRQRCAGPHRTLERCRVHRAADAAHRAACAQEPLGIYVNGLSWSRELEANEGAKP